MARVFDREMIWLVAGSGLAGLALLPAWAAIGQPIIWKGLIAALAMAVGSTLTGVLWVAFGRPPHETVWKERPMVAVVLTATFVLGTIPAAAWMH